jgi:hypothetical protein
MIFNDENYDNGQSAKLDNPCIGYTITGALHIRGVLI